MNDIIRARLQQTYDNIENLVKTIEYKTRELEGLQLEIKELKLNGEIEQVTKEYLISVLKELNDND